MPRGKKVLLVPVATKIRVNLAVGTLLLCGVALLGAFGISMMAGVMDINTINPPMRVFSLVGVQTVPEVKVIQGTGLVDPGVPGYYGVNFDNALQKFYQSNSDNYDFVIFFPMVPLQANSSARVNVTTKGIGLPEFHPYTYTQKLQSVVQMDLYAMYKNGLTTLSNSMLYDVLLHEIAHNWLVYIRGGGIASASGHWMNNAELYTENDKYNHTDIIGYDRWYVNNKGTATCVGHNASSIPSNFSNLSLSLMGMIGPDKVGNIKVNDYVPNVNYSSTGPYCSDNPVFTGSHIVTIQDIINANGPRIPSYTTSQKIFKVAFVVLVPDGQTVDQGFVNYVRSYAQALPAAWAQATNNLSSILIDYTAPTITITSPNGNETWHAGETHTIAWSSSNLTSTTPIQISLFSQTSPTTNVQSVIKTTTNTGSYNWTIPSNLNGGNVYKVIIYATGASVSKMSANYFSVTKTIPSVPTVTSVSPTSGAIGSTVTVTGTGFTATNNTSFVRCPTMLANAMSYSASANGTTLTFSIPSTLRLTGYPVSCSIGVTNANGSSNTVSFSVTAAK